MGEVVQVRAQWHRGAALVVVLGMLALGAVGFLSWRARPSPGEGVWRPGFGQSRALVANERDVASTPAPGSAPSDWIVTSGSLFSDAGSGWTGPIDGLRPDAGSATTTGSAVFRAVSTPTFLSCRVAFDLRIDGLTATPRTPARAYDGVHVFVRYADPWNLYAVSVARRDGTVVIKRKQGSGGAGAQDEMAGYVTLATASAAFPLRQWRRVEVQVTDVVGGVRIVLRVDQQTLLDVVDEGVDGGPPLRAPGRVGLRGDNTEFHFRSVVVTPIG